MAALLPILQWSCGKCTSIHAPSHFSIAFCPSQQSQLSDFQNRLQCHSTPVLYEQHNTLKRIVLHCRLYRILSTLLFTLSFSQSSDTDGSTLSKFPPIVLMEEEAEDGTQPIDIQQRSGKGLHPITPLFHPSSTSYPPSTPSILDTHFVAITHQHPSDDTTTITAMTADMTALLLDKSFEDQMLTRWLKDARKKAELNALTSFQSGIRLVGRMDGVEMRVRCDGDVVRVRLLHVYVGSTFRGHFIWVITIYSI